MHAELKNTVELGYLSTELTLNRCENFVVLVSHFCWHKDGSRNYVLLPNYVEIRHVSGKQQVSYILVAWLFL